MSDIIVDTDREFFFRCIFLQFVVDSLDLVRSSILGSDTVTAADQLDASVLQDAQDIEIQRLSRTDFLCSIQNCDLLDGLRQNVEEVFCGERSVQMYGNDTDLFAFCAKSVDDFLDRLDNGTHREDNSFRFRITVICEWFVFSSSVFRDLSHVISYDIRNLCEMLILSFSGLEYDVIILGTASGDRIPVRIQGIVLESLDCVHIKERSEVVIIHDFHFLDLMRSSETVEEMNERNRSLDRRKVCDTCQIHSFLNGVGAQHCAACLSCGVDIFMVTEDGKSARCKSSRCDMYDTRKKFSGPLVHVRNHQQ